MLDGAHPGRHDPKAQVMHDNWLWTQRALREGQPPPASSAGWDAPPLGGGLATEGRCAGQMPGSVTGRPVVPAALRLRTR